MWDNISLEKLNTSKILKDWDSEKSDLPRSGFWWGCEEKASGTDPVFPEGASKSLGESWPCKLIWASLMWPDIWKCESKSWYHGKIWTVGQTCGYLTCCVTALLSLTPLSHFGDNHRVVLKRKRGNGTKTRSCKKCQEDKSTIDSEWDQMCLN